mmetsp:Transcript_1160/g.1800  ORF Transcript_1160/g.1800 Transcript_1160/m.1800 type:complete len:82 (-) Transcript_1160:133-378(-)
MPFVYQGAGKKQGESCTDPCLKSRRCQKLACDIQWCLSRSNYQQHKCKDFVERWDKCCEVERARHAAALEDPPKNASTKTK